MIDLQLWLELATFAKTGTLSKTAEELYLTQPSVTRGMQKLEAQLAVPLFERTANHLKLNPAGQLAATYAQKLLAQETEAVTAIRNFAKLSGNFVLASVAPGPLLLAESLQTANNCYYQEQLLTEEQVVRALTNYQATVVISTVERQTKELESLYLGREYLKVKLNKFMPLASRQRVSFADLAKLSFLVLQDIGPWRQLTEACIPEAHFLYQDDLTALNELSQYSTFPTFRSNLTEKLQIHDLDDDQRVTVPIVDPQNQLDFYAVYLSSNQARVKPYLRQLAAAWPSEQDK